VTPFIELNTHLAPRERRQVLRECLVLSKETGEPPLAGTVAVRSAAASQNREGPMREMTAPERAVTVSKDRPNKEFRRPARERSTAWPRPGTNLARSRYGEMEVAGSWLG